jgi:hypothetical protein
VEVGRRAVEARIADGHAGGDVERAAQRDAEMGEVAQTPARCRNTSQAVVVVFVDPARYSTLSWIQSLIALTRA